MDLSALSELISGGSQFLPAPFNVIGGIAGAGLGQAAQSQANKNQIPQTDPMQMQFLGELDRTRKSFETSSAYQAELRQLKGQQSATQQGMIRAAGGSTGALIAGLNRAGQSAMSAYQDVAARGEQRQDMYTQMYGSLLDKMAERKLDIQTMQYAQQQTDARQAKSQTLQNLYNLLALKPTDQSKGGGMGQLRQTSPESLFSGGGGGYQQGIGLQNTLPLINQPLTF